MTKLRMRRAIPPLPHIMERKRNNPRLYFYLVTSKRLGRETEHDGPAIRTWLKLR